MFEKLTKGYIQQEAPATVIPRCMPFSMAKEKYGRVYKLASNENPFGASPKAMEAIRAATAECSLYSDGSREKVLRAKLAARHSMQPENVFLSSGAANVLSDLAEVFIRPGDECIISGPSYPPYYFWTFQHGGTIVEVPCREADQTMDMEGMKAALTERTKLLFLCNPNNPTSTALPREEMIALLQKLPKTTILIADEAYVDYSDDPEGLTLIPLLAEFPNLVVVRTFSKIYGMASVRLGYALACQEIIEYLNRAIGARDLNCFGIEGGIAALDDEEFRQKTIDNNRVERAYLIEAITSLGYQVSKSQTNFLWVDMGMPAADVHDALLPHGILIRGDFRLPRMSVGLHVENETLVNALKAIKAKGG